MTVVADHTLSPRINRALAELEFELWESIVNGELEPDTDLKFNFVVRKTSIARIIEESVEVTIAIRKKDAAN